MLIAGNSNIVAASLLYLMTSLTPVAADGKELKITLVWSPVWHLRFHDRLMPSHDTFSYVKQHHPTEINDTVLTNSDIVSWSTFLKDTMLVSFECQGGYDDPRFISEINRGFIGIFLEKVQYIKISDCIIQKLSDDTFQGLTRLATIEISSKYLLHLPPDIFKPLKNLIWINFSYCNIESISSDLFCQNPRLTFVSFKNNSIRFIKGAQQKNQSCRAGTLNSLCLDGNDIGDLSNVNFYSFKLNGILTLANSSIRTISKKPFEGLSNVMTIDLKNNYIRYIPDHIFTSLNTTLRYMNFGNNRIQNIDVSKTFSGLELDALHLDSNYITSITGKLSQIKSLNSLYLQNNSLTELTYATFGNLSSLRKLELSNNRIKMIEAGIFDTSINLQEIYLSRNNISYLPKGIFHNTFRLTHLSMYSNLIESMDENLFLNCRGLEKVELQHNKLSNITRFFISSTKLRYFHIEYNKMSSVPILTTTGNGSECTRVKSLVYINAGHNEIFYFNASCYRDVVFLYLSYNYISDISNFDELQNIKSLFLRNNNIKILPKTAIKGLCTKLSRLDIGNNLIETIDEGTFSSCYHLTQLKLDGNRLKTLEPLYLESLHDLRLSKNPLRCECPNQNLINWLYTSSTVHVDYTRCPNGHALSTFRFENCTKPVVISNLKTIIKKMAIPASTLLVISGIIGVVFLKFRYEIQVIAFYKWNIRFRCCCMNKTEDNVKLKYDAFICFAEEDIVFVKTRLIPVLEPKYNVCIYYRDFPVGDDIAESILETISNSAVVIILLSENFINSRWGTFEFRSAHYAAMSKKNKRLLIIILNESLLEIKMDLTLRSVLYAKSYLNANDSLFKEKLTHSMPPIPVQSNKQNDYEDCKSAGRQNVFEIGDTIELSDIYDTIQL